MVQRDWLPQSHSASVSVGNSDANPARRFQALLENSWEAVALQSAAGRFSYVSPAYSRIMGYAPEEVLGRRSDERVHPDDLVKVQRMRREVLRQPGISPIIELRSRHKDGSYRWLEVRATNLLAEPDVQAVIINFRDVTERKQAETALRESEARFRAIYDHALEAIVIFNDELQFVDANPAACALFGLTRAEIITRCATDVVAPDRAELYERGLRLMFKQGERRGRFPLQRPDGVILEIEYSAKANFLPGLHLSLLRDSTERVKAEQEMRESERRLAQVFNASPHPLALSKWGDGKFTHINTAFLKTLGYTAEEALGYSGGELGIWADPADRVRFYQQLQEEGQFSDQETILRTKDGQHKHMLLSAEVLELGGEKYVLSASTDISERKQMENALRASEERFSQAFYASPYPMVIVAYPEGRFVSVNERMVSFAGYTAEEMVGRSLAELDGWLSPADRESFYRQLAEAGRIRDWEVSLRDKYGAVLTMLLSAEIIQMSGAPHLLVVANDITARKAAEIVLAASRAQLRALSAHLATVREEERIHIAREIHDELGQLLTGLKLDIAWLNRRLAKVGVEALRKQLLDKTQSINGLLDRTIQTVRNLATRLRPGVLDTLGLTAAIEWQVQEFAARTSIKCQTTLSPEPDGLTKDQTTALFRILQELLTNVSRHAQATQVAIRFAQQHGQIELAVTDDGRGITPEQLNNPKSLGLLGLRERALMLNGEIRFQGSVGRGAEVIVRIPYGQAESLGSVL